MGQIATSKPHCLAYLNCFVVSMADQLSLDDVQVAALKLGGKMLAFAIMSVPFIVLGGLSYCYFSGSHIRVSLFEAWAVLFNVPGGFPLSMLARSRQSYIDVCARNS